MIVIVCVDDRMGMMFGGRRQSKDRYLQLRILEHTQGQRLWMNAYSARQFEEHHAPQIQVAEDFLEQAGYNDFCFVENLSLIKYQSQIHTVILYHWNRRYPGSMYFDLPLEEYQLDNQTDFAGYSHENITEEIYRK